jgi:3-oxoacyl-[acyl-carrier-protein] synthase-3
MQRGTLKGLGVRFGSVVRGNDYYREHYQDVIDNATQKSLAKAFSPADGSAASRAYDEEMGRYLSDPFRGTVERRILAAGETALSLSEGAARDALAAAKVAPKDIDLILCASWLPEYFVAPGDAVFLAQALGVKVPAWNIESACSSGLVILQMAHAMIASRQFRRVLCVVSSTNSRHTAPNDSLGWISSDGAAAAVVEAVDEANGEGILGTFSVNTAETCGVFVHELVAADNGKGAVRMQVGSVGTKALRESTGPELVKRCCEGAAKASGATLADIRFYGFSTPLAWFSSLCVKALEIDPARTLNLFPRFANVGAPFPLVNLYFGAQQGLLKPGDLGLIYTVGSVSSAGAMVVRWGDVGLGPTP